MARCFEESHQAYEGGDGARAKELSNEGKRHKAEMERLNDEASAWIFRGMCSICWGFVLVMRYEDGMLIFSFCFLDSVQRTIWYVYTNISIHCPHSRST